MKKKWHSNIIRYSAYIFCAMAFYQKGVKVGYEDGYKKGYLIGGADMYDSHIYPDDGVSYDVDAAWDAEKKSKE